MEEAQKLLDISDEEDETSSTSNESTNESGQSASEGSQRNSVSNIASDKDNNASPPKGNITAAGEGSDPSKGNNIQSTSSITTIIRKKNYKETSLKATLEANTTSRKPYPYGYEAIRKSNGNKVIYRYMVQDNPSENNPREKPRIINATNVSIREITSGLNNNTKEPRGTIKKPEKGKHSVDKQGKNNLENKSIDNHSAPKRAIVKDTNWGDDNHYNHQVRSNIPPKVQLVYKQLGNDGEEARQTSITKNDRATLPEENLRFLLFIPKHRQERQVLADFRRFGTVINLTILPDKGQWNTVGFILFENTGVVRIALDENSDIYRFKKIRGRVIDKHWKHDPYTIHSICKRRMYRGNIRGHARICDSGRLQVFREQTSHALYEDVLSYKYH
ncbi:hypothetical protein TKK_0013754 [Trichogramma kaykai]|uniref:RRM domain-containing protein n=1 Tax=Trichogramma kaykai TaxID=54128 RepID=A0ABD2WGR4_9HYME